MNLSLSWINIIILFGAVNATLFAIVLFFNRRHPGARFLAGLMLVLAYNGFETLNWSAGFYRYILFFDLFPFILIFAAGPSIYLYISSILDPSRRFRRAEILNHYGIVIFQFAVRGSIVVQYYLWRGGLLEKNAVTDWMAAIYTAYSEPLSVLVYLGYLAATLRLYARTVRGQFIPAMTRPIQRHTRRWLNTTMIFLIALGVIWPLTILAPFLLPDIPVDSQYYPVEVFLVFFIYWLTFAGHYYIRIIQVPSSGQPRQGMDVGEAGKIVSRLRGIMEGERLYLNPSLTLSSLSATAGIPAKRISVALNQYEGSSFSDFVNDYRVREVQSRLLTPENERLTISGIALESGFNSHATFQRVFRSVTGMSPREYMSRNVINHN